MDADLSFRTRSMKSNIQNRHPKNDLKVSVGHLRKARGGPRFEGYFLLVRRNGLPDFIGHVLDTNLLSPVEFSRITQGYYDLEALQNPAKCLREAESTL